MTMTTAAHTRPLTARRILIVEDDRDIANLVALHLRDVYDDVQMSHDGAEALSLASTQPWDLLILDLRLPGMDGLEVCRQIRASENYVPILMLTSKSTELDHVLGLEIGADDYVTKPFSVVELMSRVKAILRRMSVVSRTVSAPLHELSHEGIHVSLDKHEVTIDGQSVDLTAREFELLCHFLKRPGEVFSRAQLLDQVWGYGHEGYEHTVNSHINRLRTKIETDPTRPTRLVTVWGVGYKLAQ